MTIDTSMSKLIAGGYATNQELTQSYIFETQTLYKYPLLMLYDISSTATSTLIWGYQFYVTQPYDYWVSQVTLSPDANFYIAHTMCNRIDQQEYLIGGKTISSGSVFAFALDTQTNVLMSHFRSQAIIISPIDTTNLEYRAYIMRIIGIESKKHQLLSLKITSSYYASFAWKYQHKQTVTSSAYAFTLGTSETQLIVLYDDAYQSTYNINLLSNTNQTTPFLKKTIQTTCGLKPSVYTLFTDIKYAYNTLAYGVSAPQLGGYCLNKLSMGGSIAQAQFTIPEHRLHGIKIISTSNVLIVVSVLSETFEKFQTYLVTARYNGEASVSLEYFASLPKVPAKGLQYNELKAARFISDTEFLIIGTSRDLFFRGGTYADQILAINQFRNSFIYSSSVANSCYAFIEGATIVTLNPVLKVEETTIELSSFLEQYQSFSDYWYLQYLSKALVSTSQITNIDTWCWPKYFDEIPRFTQQFASKIYINQGVSFEYVYPPIAHNADLSSYIWIDLNPLQDADLLPSPSTIVFPDISKVTFTIDISENPSTYSAKIRISNSCQISVRKIEIVVGYSGDPAIATEFAPLDSYTTPSPSDTLTPVVIGDPVIPPAEADPPPPPPTPEVAAIQCATSHVPRSQIALQIKVGESPIVLIPKELFPEQTEDETLSCGFVVIEAKAIAGKYFDKQMVHILPKFQEVQIAATIDSQVGKYELQLVAYYAEPQQPKKITITLNVTSNELDSDPISKILKDPSQNFTSPTQLQIYLKKLLPNTSSSLITLIEDESLIIPLPESTQLTLAEMQHFSVFQNGILEIKPTHRNVGMYDLACRFFMNDQREVDKVLRFNVVAIQGAKENNRTCAYGARQKCYPQVSEVDRKGMLTLYFPMSLVNTTEEDVKLALKLELQRNIIDGNNSSLSSWEIISISSKFISIQLIFSDPLLVSSNIENKDYLRITFIRPNYIEVSFKDFMIPSQYRLLYELPRQQPNSSNSFIRSIHFSPYECH
ncbi:hypothetical protein FGO68_gene9704 [Halteria grandinella]|uniref:Uncharacterized protein n=1 Tax=Halteria grandinella TaxID=5974 RepID=A0A8J8P6K0_HALGN|nr:hypothetical protein FGO68_gene9704 [Halteria grandinella]